MSSYDSYLAIFAFILLSYLVRVDVQLGEHYNFFWLRWTRSFAIIQMEDFTRVGNYTYEVVIYIEDFLTQGEKWHTMTLGGHDLPVPLIFLLIIIAREKDLNYLEGFGNFFFTIQNFLVSLVYLLVTFWEFEQLVNDISLRFFIFFWWLDCHVCAQTMDRQIIRPITVVERCRRYILSQLERS